MGKWARYRKIGRGAIVGAGTVLLQESVPAPTSDVAFTNGFPQLATPVTSLADQTITRIDVRLRRVAPFDPQVAVSLWSDDGITPKPLALLTESALAPAGTVSTDAITVSAPIPFTLAPTLLTFGTNYWIVVRSVPTPSAGVLFWGHQVISFQLDRGNGIGGWFIQDASSKQSWALYGTVP